MMLRITPLPGEERLLVVRKIPTRLRKQIFVDLVFFVLSIIAFIYSQNQYLFLIGVLSLIITITIGLVIFFIWYSDTTIVTNKRLVLIDKTGLFAHNVSEVSIHDIVAVTYTQKGFWGAITSSGRIEILDIVGHKIFLENVMSPQVAYETIQAIVNRTRKNV